MSRRLGGHCRHPWARGSKTAADGEAQHADARREGAREDEEGRPAQRPLVGPAQRRGGQQRRPGGVRAARPTVNSDACRGDGPFLQRPGKRRQRSAAARTRRARRCPRVASAAAISSSAGGQLGGERPWPSRRRARTRGSLRTIATVAAPSATYSTAPGARHRRGRMTSAGSERTQRSSQITGGRRASGELGLQSRPGAGRALDMQRSAQRLDAVGQSAQAGAASGIRAPAAVVGDAHHELARRSP